MIRLTSAAVDAGLAPRRTEGGRDHHVHEAVSRLLDDPHLQVFLRLEVGVEPGLAQAGALGERADREPVEPLHARFGERVREDRATGLFAFAHDRIIVRPFVASRPGLRRILGADPGVAVGPRSCRDP